jgi:threonine aldolase
VEDPETNLVFFDISGTGMNVARLQEKLQMRGIAISGLGGRVRACTHLDVTPAMIEEAVSEIRTALKAA